MPLIQTCLRVNVQVGWDTGERGLQRELELRVEGEPRGSSRLLSRSQTCYVCTSYIPVPVGAHTNPFQSESFLRPRMSTLLLKLDREILVLFCWAVFLVRWLFFSPFHITCCVYRLHGYGGRAVSLFGISDLL